MAAAGILAVSNAGTATHAATLVDTLHVSTAAKLATTLAEPLQRVVVRLAPGVYALAPSPAVDSTCGNCENPDTLIRVAVGLTVSGRDVWITGPTDGEAVIVTRAGYGLYFKNCADCGVENVTITGGERDTSAAATDAAIVAKNSAVHIRRCVIRDNIGDPETLAETVVGIMGVCGREGSEITLEQCEILRNSWDGVALFRDARAVIRNNLIDGVDNARTGTGGGRGVAIGVTWNAHAVIERNVIRRYWKGIGVFVDADVVARENIVEDMLTWGIAVWDADKGRPRAVIEENVVYNCGACGIAITRSTPFAPNESPGRLVGNIVVHTGQNPKYDDPDSYCYQCALALHAVPDGFVIRGNAFHDNREASENLFDEDTSREMFWRERRGWVRKHWNTGVGVDGRRRFHESSFLTRYTRRLH